MTDRVNYLTVALDEDLKLDEAQMLVEAISLMRGVRSVQANVIDAPTWTIIQRVRAEYAEKIGEAIGVRFG